MERPENSIDLFDYIREKGKINEQEAKIIFQQVLGAVNHIHNSGVVHRDIKDENIVLNRETGAIKIIDFGCGTLLKAAPYRDFSGTPEFYPPEWFNKRYYYARLISFKDPKYLLDFIELATNFALGRQQPGPWESSYMIWFAERFPSKARRKLWKISLHSR